jgi:hypothetical protein
LAGFNSQFNLFVLDNIGFENFAPLENYGNITVKGNASVLLSSKIRSIETNSLYYFMLKIKEIVVYFR